MQMSTLVKANLVKANFTVDGEVDTDATKKAYEWFMKFLDDSANMLCK